VYLRGVYPVYGEMRNTIPERGGRFLNPIDIEHKKRSIFLGSTVKQELFGDEPAVGRLVTLNSVPFQVVGVLIGKTQNSSYGSRDETAAFIPATTFAALFGHKYINNMVIQGKDLRQNERLQKDILGVLAKKYRFHPDDEEAIGIWDMSEGEKLFTAFQLGFNIFLGIVGAFTLIVGGIGVSNIMNVVVEERTREVGLKMAVGAKKRFVLSQFLFETILITLMGLSASFPTRASKRKSGSRRFHGRLLLSQ
jgi:putative ABC transport system permease protein